MFSNTYATGVISGDDYYNYGSTMNDALAADPDVVLNAGLPSLADFASDMEMLSPSIESRAEGDFAPECLELMHDLPVQVHLDQSATPSTNEPDPTVDMAYEAQALEVAPAQTTMMDHDEVSNQYHADDASDEESGGSEDDGSASSESEESEDSEEESSEDSESDSSEDSDEESRASVDSMPGPPRAVGAAPTSGVPTLSSVPAGPPPTHKFSKITRKKQHKDLWSMPEEELLAFKPYLDGASRPANSRPLPDQTRVYKLTRPGDWEKEMETIRGQQNAVALLEALRIEINTDAAELRARFTAPERGKKDIRLDVDKIKTIVLNRIRVEMAIAKGETPPTVPAEPGKNGRKAILRRIRETERVRCAWCGGDLCNRKNAYFKKHLPQCPPWLALDDRFLVGRWRALHRQEVHEEHRQQLDFPCTQGRKPAARPRTAAASQQQNAETPGLVRAQKPRATRAAAPRTTAASGATRTRTRARNAQAGTADAPSTGAPRQPPMSLRPTTRGQTGTAQQSAAGPTRTLRSATRGARPYP